MALDAIIINGAPGVGKSTVAAGLKVQLGWSVIELGFLRMTYLDWEWKTANSREAKMSFEIMCHMVHRFVEYGFRNTLLVDLLAEHVEQVGRSLEGLDYLIVSLIVRDKEVHRSRVLEPTRDSGYRDVEKAWAWNNSILSRPPLPREVLLDTTHDTAAETMARIIRAVS
jgi:chloramphenicol 3-O-phosphotransferase